MPSIDPRLATVLVCPLCHGELHFEESAAQLRCNSCQQPYSVRDFPIMMPEAVTQDGKIDPKSKKTSAEVD